MNINIYINNLIDIWNNKDSTFAHDNIFDHIGLVCSMYINDNWRLNGGIFIKAVLMTLLYNWVLNIESLLILYSDTTHIAKALTTGFLFYF